MSRRRRKETMQAESKNWIHVQKTVVGEPPEDLNQSDEVISVQTFETDPAYVRVNMGATKNIGDYESLRVDVSISVPCYKEEVEDMVPEVADMAADMLQDQIDEFMGVETEDE